MNARPWWVALVLSPLASGCGLVVVDYGQQPEEGPSDWEILGERTGDEVGGGGVAVVGAAGEAQAALAVGAPGESSGGPDAGAVALHLSSPGAQVAFGEGEALLLGSSGDRLGAALHPFSEDSEHDWLAVGSPGAAVGEDTRAGTVWLLDPSTLEGVHSVDQLAVARVDGYFEDTLLGSGITSGDLDGDGLNDLVLGGPGADGAQGRVYFFIGGDLDQGRSTADADGYLDGGQSGDALGFGLQAGSDVNGDGVADLLVCAGSADLYTDDDVGACAIFEGGEGLLGGWWESFWFSSSATIRGVDAGDQAGLGRQGALLQDLDGDGRPDLVVGASGTDAETADAGQVAVLHNDQLSGSTDLASADLRVVGSGAFGSALGTFGTSGLLWVGAPTAGAAEEGALYLLDGTLVGELGLAEAGGALLQSGVPGDMLGEPGSLVADLDGDGSLDMAAATAHGQGLEPEAGLVKITSSIQSP